MEGCKYGPTNMPKEEKQADITKRIEETRTAADNFTVNIFVPEFDFFAEETFTRQQVRDLFVKYGHCIIPTSDGSHIENT